MYEEKKGKIVPYPFLSEDNKRLEEELYYDIERIHLLKGRFTCTKTFLELWGDWYTSQEEKNPFGSTSTRAFDGYIERRPTQVLKLSMVMNAARTESMCLDEIDLRKAIDLLERTEVKMPRAFGGIGMSSSSNLTYRILEAITISGGLTLSGILSRFMYDGNQEEVTSVLNTLSAAGIVKAEVIGGKTIYSATRGV